MEEILIILFEEKGEQWMGCETAGELIKVPLSFLFSPSHMGKAALNVTAEKFTLNCMCQSAYESIYLSESHLNLQANISTK